MVGFFFIFLEIIPNKTMWQFDMLGLGSQFGNDKDQASAKLSCSLSVLCNGSGSVLWSPISL